LVDASHIVLIYEKQFLVYIAKKNHLPLPSS
jgi:hypothetical protein